MGWIKRIADLWAGRVQVGPERLLTKDERTEIIAKITVRTDSINGAIDEHCMKAYGKGWGYRSCTRDSLSEYSDRTLMVILDYLMQDTVDILPLHHKSNFMRQITRPESDTDETTIREFISLQPYIQMITYVDSNNYFSMLRAIHEYASIPAMLDYSYADDDTKRQVAALLTVTSSMYQVYVNALDNETSSGPSRYSHISHLPILMAGGIRISDEKLISLVMEIPDKAESIATVIIDDKVADTSLIRDKVLSGSQSLREGIL